MLHNFFSNFFSEAKKVLSRQTHVLENAYLRVRAMEPAPPCTLFMGPAEDKLLLVKHMPESFRLADLKKYMSGATQYKSCQIAAWNSAGKKGQGVMEFDRTPGENNVDMFRVKFIFSKLIQLF